MSPLLETEPSTALRRGSSSTMPEHGDKADQPHDEEDDCRSVRSLPLLHDDDYFYYHGGSDADVDDGSSSGSARVDHVGALIRPLVPTAKVGAMEQALTSLPCLDASEARSEVTCDDMSMDTAVRNQAASETAREDISIEEVVTLKLRVAELESQLLLQSDQRGNPLQPLVTELKEAKLSLECENVGLKQKLKQMEEAAAKERIQARQVEEYIQEKISELKKENEKAAKRCETLLKENQRLKERQRKRAGRASTTPTVGHEFKNNRRSSTGDNPYPEEGNDSAKESATEYVPFPKASRRHSTGERPPNLMVSSISCGREARTMTKRPSLLDVLRSSFNSNNLLETKSNTGLEGSDTSRSLSTKASSEQSPEEVQVQEQASWAATCDEINAQTELFNRQSTARLRARLQQELLDGSSKSDGDMSQTSGRQYGSEGDIAQEAVMSSPYRRPRLDRSLSDRSALTARRPSNESCGRPRVQRRQSFTIESLGETLGGLRSSFSKNSLSDEDFDVNSVLWDGSSEEDEEEEEQRTVHTRRTVDF